MKNFLLFVFGFLATLCRAQESLSLNYFIEKAAENSPLIIGFQNQAAIEEDEEQRLKAFYTHSRVELDGEYLFVPVISRDGGKTSFKIDAQDGTDYYGYDLGESSGHLHAGVSFVKPLLGGRAYRAAAEQTRVNREMALHHTRMQRHELERTVTEQYLMCLLDTRQAAFADSMAAVIGRQRQLVGRLVTAGMAKQSGLQLLDAELSANTCLHESAMQSYRTHLADLCLLCGIAFIPDAHIADTDIAMSAPLQGGGSLFTEQYRLDSLSTEASLRQFGVQYMPQLNFFASGGLQTGAFSNAYKHFGWSAGLSFTWTLADGKQRQHRERQARLRQLTTSACKANADLQRRTRTRQCMAEIESFGRRETELRAQMKNLDSVLGNYYKEIAAGQMSVTDYITILKSRIQVEKDLMLLLTNRKIAVAAYNYWNR